MDAPDLVVEILSEHTETIDRQKKLALYEKHSVKEYWIADPAEKVIEQFLLKKEKLQLHTKARNDEKLSAILMNDFSFPVNQIFG